MKIDDSKTNLSRRLEELKKMRQFCRRNGSWAFEELFDKDIKEIEKKKHEDEQKNL